MNGFVKVYPTEKDRLALLKMIGKVEMFKSNQMEMEAVYYESLFEVPRKFLFWTIPTKVLNVGKATELAPYGVELVHLKDQPVFRKTPEFEGLKKLAKLIDSSGGQAIYVDLELLDVLKEVRKYARDL